MTDPATKTARKTAEAKSAQLGFLRQISLMIRAISSSPVGRKIVILMVAIVLVIVATAYGQIRLNSWNRPFYDALSRRDFARFSVSAWRFLRHCRLHPGAQRAAKMAWRNAAGQIARGPGAQSAAGLDAARAGHFGSPIPAAWASIRISAFTRTRESCANLSASLGIGLFQASILFGTFAGILWGLSSNFSIHFEDRDYTIPGFMLWAAIVYASAGSLLSYWVGRGLINRNAERYAREADLRFSLVRVNEHVDDISLAAGEQDERRRIERRLADALRATRRIVWGHTNLEWVTAGFGWITIVAPILVAAPLYFTGKVSFGGMMMAAGAFTQAQSSLRWFIDNFSVIADWRATLLRVANFRHAVINTDEPRGFESRIDYDGGRPRQNQNRKSPQRIVRARRHAQGTEGGRRGGRARLGARRARDGQDAAVPRHGGVVAMGFRPHHASARRTDIHTCRAAHRICPEAACAKCLPIR